MTRAVAVEVVRPDGSLQAFLDEPIPEEPVAVSARPRVLRVEVAQRTLVLGSTQHEAVVDPSARAAAGVALARRRSGGGAVLHGPGEAVWAEVWLPRSDPRWDDDVARSSWWLGQAWATVLGDLGVAGADVHRGPLLRTAWSDHVCFGGLGPGEVTVGGAKVVGIAQRRTRSGARFQCALLQRWEPSELVELLALGAGERVAAASELRGAARGVEGVEPAVVVDLLAQRVARQG